MSNYLFELHMHTKEVSRCGKVPAREAIHLYNNLGYKGVCITDHFNTSYFDTLGHMSWPDKIDTYLQGYREALDEGKKLGIKVVLGMEFCFTDTYDDILIYGFDEDFLFEHENLDQMDYIDLSTLRKDFGLLLIQAHPFRKKISRRYEELVDGFEAFNGNPRHDSMNQVARQFAEDFGGIVVSGSDFHQVQDAGTGGIYLPELPSDSFELAAMLRDIRTPKLNCNGNNASI